MFRHLLAIIITTLLLLLALPSNTSAAVNSGPQYDPQGDVALVSQTVGMQPVDGWEDLDILTLDTTIETGVVQERYVFSLMVKGQIANSQSDQYLLMINADGTEYIISYSNGDCSGLNMDTMQPIVIRSCEGDETSTLKVTVQTRELGDPSSNLNIRATAIHQISESETYIDSAPGKLLFITAPKLKETVYGTVSIEGWAKQHVAPVEWVEVQLPGDDQWQRVASESGELWSNWSYRWDTTTVSDGDHTLKARSYDGQHYFTDELTITVEQDIQSTTPSVQLPTMRIGDRYDYVSNAQTQAYGYNIDTLTDQTVTVAAYDEITLPSTGETVGVFRRDIEQSGTMTVSGIEVETESEGETVVTADSLAIVRSETVMTMNVPYVGEMTTESKMQYTPPLSTVAFPLRVTDRWNATSTVRSTTNTSSAQGGESSNSTDTVTNQYICLATESIEVPAGSYETVVVYTEQIDGSFTLDYYAEGLSSAVRSETYTPERELVTILELADFVEGEPMELLVDTITVYPNTPTVGRTATISARLHNTGPLECEDCQIIFTVDAERLAIQQMTIPGGAQRTVSVDWVPTTDGTHTIVVTTGTDAAVLNVEVGPEPGEGDNTTALTVESVTLDPQLPAVGETVSITAELQNEGADDCVDCAVRFIIDTQEHAVEVVEVAAGGQTTVTVRWTPDDDGAHTVVVSTDSDAASVNIEVEPEAGAEGGLIIENIILDPSEPSAGDTVEIAVELHNTASEACEDCRVLLTIDGEQYAVEEVSIPSTGRRTVSVDWTPSTDGAHTIVVNTDTDEASMSVAVRTKPDDEPSPGFGALTILLALLGTVTLGLWKRWNR